MSDDTLREAYGALFTSKADVLRERDEWIATATRRAGELRAEERSHAITQSGLSAALDIAEHQTREVTTLRARVTELAEALEGMLDCSACRNGCAPDDMTCATSGARLALSKVKR